MRWTEAQTISLAKAFYRFDSVVCPKCTGHVAVDRMPLPQSGGASHLRFVCRGCRQTGELADFVEPADGEWTERERRTVEMAFRWGVPVKCPRDGAVFSAPERDPGEKPLDMSRETLACPICARQAAI
jgi:hypothetical protein